MRKIGYVALVTGALAFMVAASSEAGVIDSPIPTIASKPARRLFVIPAVTKNNLLETEFNCTSLETSGPITIAVEIFAAAGGGPLNDVSLGSGAGAQAVPVGGSVTFGTGNTNGIHEDEVILGLPNNIKGGSARILATSKRIICFAFVVDEVNQPPTSMVPLRVRRARSRLQVP